MKVADQALIALFSTLGFCATSRAANSEMPLPKDPDVLSKAYPGKSYSPYAGRSFPRPLWGDSHLHTGNSFDAGAFGARPLTHAIIWG